MKIPSQIYNATLSIKLLNRVKQQCWLSPGKADTWWTKLISGKIKEEEWCLSVMVDLHYFMELVNSIHDYVQPNLRSFRSDTVGGEIFAMVLSYWKDQGSFRMISNTFGVFLATLSRSLQMVSYTINKILGTTLIKFPSTIEEITLATQKFEHKFDIPQVIGCVDGTHIPIVQPPQNSYDHFCYNMKLSLNCQAIYDENSHFTDL